MNQTPQLMRRYKWLNRTVLGIGLASLFSDWSHEIVTTVLPLLLANLGGTAAWLGIIEGIADGVSSFAKLFSGFFTDKLQKRKRVAVAGYLLTTFCTALTGLTTAAWHVLILRTLAWLGRGVRTPVRKALLASAVTPEIYGRAFGFERMMDTLGAIVGPMTAITLLPIIKGNFAILFGLAAIPGLMAAIIIALTVHEQSRTVVPYVSFVGAIKELPSTYHRFLIGVSIFGIADFSHTLLILLATTKLTPTIGPVRAAALGASLYLLRNTFYAGFAVVAGWLADKFAKPLVLGFGYLLAALMSLLIIVAPPSIACLALIFAIGGIYIATEETLEDSLCAELVPPSRHGTAFGLLAAVNAVGDMVSSILVGVIWQVAGPSIAFAYCTVLFTLGALIIFNIPKNQIKQLNTL